MKAVEVRAFGGLGAMEYRDVPTPSPGDGQVLVRVLAAGVGPWDAWVREGRSRLPQPLPLVLGADISGVVAAVGPRAGGFAKGDEVYGVTNPRFTGAYAEFAVAEAAMIARMPVSLSHPEAASVPVVATTAWQMLFERAGARSGQRVLVHGGAGNVGAYAVQLAHWAGLDITATAYAEQTACVQAFGATQVLDGRADSFDGLDRSFDIVIDTVGCPLLARSYGLLRPGGVLVSAVSAPDQEAAARHGVRAEFVLVSVATAGLERLAELLDAGTLKPRVGEIMPLSEARTAHEMLGGRRHRPGKIVLVPRTSGSSAGCSAPRNPGRPC